ncbi:MAG: hypothetical protein K8F62_16530 [Pseudorhodoplanes sp.]|nr:hypothetical protein [Pseudorhodoplanes sp.]
MLSLPIVFLSSARCGVWFTTHRIVFPLRPAKQKNRSPDGAQTDERFPKTAALLDGPSLDLALLKEAPFDFHSFKSRANRARLKNSLFIKALRDSSETGLRFRWRENLQNAEQLPKNCAVQKLMAARRESTATSPPQPHCAALVCG